MIIEIIVRSKHKFTNQTQLRDFLLQHCVNERGDLCLNNLDFSEFEGDVDISNMKVKYNLVQNFQRVGGNLAQEDQEVEGNLFQYSQYTKGNLLQHNNFVEGTLYQDSQVARNAIYQHSQISSKIIN